MDNATAGHRTPMRQPRVADLVAHELRSKILTGALADGDVLPKQGDLALRFGVSQSSIREALFRLEGEGLVAIRRGVQGGAVVRRPSPDVVSFMIGTLLQSRDTGLADLARSIELLEPMCAAEAAGRPDHEVVATHLDDLLVEEAEAIGEGAAFTGIARQFHAAVVAGSGLTSLSVAVGVLETLWSAHEQHWAVRQIDEGRYPTADEMLQAHAIHQRIAAYIRRGDARRAGDLTGRHVRATQRLVLAARGDQPISAEALGPAWARA